MPLDASRHAGQLFYRQDFGIWQIRILRQDVGDGVAFSYVAAREVARNIVGEGQHERPLPIVNHVSPRWEPEPFRYVGINSILRLTERADETERLTGRKNRFVNWLLGKLIP